MESSQWLSAATTWQHRRQLQGLPAITPEQLSQIDLADKSTLTTLVWIVSGIVIGLIAIFVPVRLVVRRRTTGRFFLDDGLIILASVFTLVVCAMAIAATRHGLGQHIWNLDFDTIVVQLRNCVQMMFVGNVFYALAIAFTKLSIIASYLHIFSPHGVMKYIMYVTGAVTIGLLVASIPATIFQCKPIAAAWDFTLPQDSCYTFVDFLYASTAINITTDLLLCTVPIPCLCSLQLPVKQKVLISGLFFLGGFACVASIVRIAYLHLLDGHYIDVTYNIVSSLLLTLAECAIGIVCVSLPSLRPLLARLFPAFFRSSWTTHRSGASSTARSRAKLGSASRQMSAARADDVATLAGGGGARGPAGIELVGPRRHESWVMLPDPEAQVDSVWERGSSRDTKMLSPAPTVSVWEP